ncbi:MAG TPA: electron transporter RnfD [Firmicutes bacterium]|jgi:electron transport complex protein RnfD|nr:electron transporter RnfD [Bacillota bacterium]HAZ23083.1 electron transporter RnfD [Bacillota bacterium]HBE07154.1 electron transporter RnfD [Bacillota bacterium]HBG45098.1 electron transporter RnfD [Bacillota bacterium]HBL67905.1 electron transporter RnfD [Bacillota bacterium]
MLLNPPRLKWPPDGERDKEGNALPERFVVTSNPHIATTQTTERIMREVMLALLPASAAAVYFFGWRVLAVIAVSMVAAVCTEAIIQKALKQKTTIMDGSAALTGLLLALTLPPTVPLWIPALGAIFAIAIAKQVFGGLGSNPFNPALIGRAFLTASWPKLMSTWKWPHAAQSLVQQLSASDAVSAASDVISSATPLELAKSMEVQVPLEPLFWGNIAGSLGEVSAMALLAGGLYLIIRRIIDWRIPVAYLGTVAVIALISRQDPLFHLLAGGLLLGAFFMATDYVTSPITRKGRVIFAIGAGLLTILFRRYGANSEGVCYSILIMNAFAPTIDRLTVPRIFGEVKGRA